MSDNKRKNLLRIAFIAGAVTDAFALIPMLFPWAAKLFWGITDVSGPYKFAMGYGAALMLGWTVFLVWACQKPIERAFAAIMTVVVIAGFVITEIAAAAAGYVAFTRMAPSFCFQAILTIFFLYSYFRK